MSDNIPFDIQMDIMNRLPVKSLLQFRTVSKQWKFSIDNFDFINENLAFRHIDSNLNIISLTPVASSEGKDYAIQQIRGSPFESFEMLPYYCYNLERKNQGTVTRIKTDEKGVFEMLFIAIGTSIRTFMHCLRPLLIIDAAHLKGQYKGTNLVVVGIDGNNQIVPIAFGICKGETGPCWSWWMSILKECIGDSPNFLFISDRHAAIGLAVHNEFSLAFHAVCFRHLMMNLSLKINKMKGLFWKICKAYTPEEFSTKMSKLQAIQPDAYHKLIEVDP
ncbi:transposase, MuDR, MULE transposase domain protein [Tanacetum coccineum]